MLRYQGLIDLSLLDRGAGELRVESQAENRSCKLPGLEMRWKAGHAEVALADGVMAMVARNARAGAAEPVEGQRWIERYVRHGEHAAEAVDGGFAVVIVDLGKRQVLLVVDRFSIETLCYRAGDGMLGFSNAASDVPKSRKTLNAQSLYDYLYFHVIPSPETVFTDVRRVEPAHCVSVSATAERAFRYWEPAFIEDDRRDMPGRLRQFAAILKSCVQQEAGEPATACFLSGGTDSSSVAGMLTQLRGEPVHAYSIGFAAEGYDEMAYARIAAHHFGLVHHEHYLTPEDVLSAIPKLAASFDQPFGNSSVLPAYYCALFAKQDGFKRILAGDGGDELFAGNSRYSVQKAFEFYHALPRSLRHALEPAANGWTLFRRVPGLKQVGGYIRHSSVPMPDRLEAFQLLHRVGEETMLEADFLARVDRGRPLTWQRTTWGATKAGSLINRMLAYDWKYTLGDSDLPKVRQATQLAGITVGYPFLSPALTDFSLTLPPEWKLKGLKLRWFFKEALRNFLPREILGKKKHGFGLPFGAWTLRHAGLRRFAEESLEGIAQRGIVRQQFTRDLLTRQLPEAPGYYGEMVWILMMLEQWLRAHQAIVSAEAPATL
ncbi:MAG TPA: asparagine synthase-related protein [Casimicrobiaceae bacterium]